MIARPHQAVALEKTIESGFQSGCHAHATGSGKSFLGMSIVRAYFDKNPRSIVIWLCEQVSVISQIFAKPGSRKGIAVCDFATNKPKDWSANLASAQTFGRPVLVIINRAFLVSATKYRHIRANVGLIVHDECHSGIGSTTSCFYDWLNVSHPECKVIGLSATPPQAKESPHPGLHQVLTRFSIYDAYKAKVILPLEIIWCPYLEHRPSHIECAKLAQHIAMRSSIDKIIVWCGTISNAEETGMAWATVFSDYVVSVDTSKSNPSHGLFSFDAFIAAKRGILVCAAKHREGSDIAGLGLGVFVDGVADRACTSFVQCAGRVLRLGGPAKNRGIILDVMARDGLCLCDKVGKYLGLAPGIMPWKLSELELNGCRACSLVLSKPKLPSWEAANSNTATSLRNQFVREIPSDPLYEERLSEELQLIEEKGVVVSMLRAKEVLRLAGDDVQHVTRGSCGSSLVCYLLGLSHVDPVKYNICFARFLNEYRDSLPDIDFDFPHSRRASVFLRMAIRWPGMVARISNHVHYHDKSALRESLRRNGHQGGMRCAELTSFMKSMNTSSKEQVMKTKKELEGTFNCYSLHCGGVVYYPDGIPREDVLEGKEGQLLTQVVPDKRVIAEKGFFKIDVLSSRALSQLVYAIEHSKLEKRLELDSPPWDDAMSKLLASGDNIGITLAESPLCRTEMMDRKPTSVLCVAECLALIRPAARQSKCELIFDDDAIGLIAARLGCSLAKADQIRRRLAKKDATVEKDMSVFKGEVVAKELIEEMGNLSLYGFCKAHAMSYAQLVTWLTWTKVHTPVTFWKGALRCCQSSYARWVHLWEACNAGVAFKDCLTLSRSPSIHSERNTDSFDALDIVQQLCKYGYWDMTKGFIPGCYYDKPSGKVRGVIANYRQVSKKKAAVLVGYGSGYVNAVTDWVFKPFSPIVDISITAANV
jgi:hypothetical protein